MGKSIDFFDSQCALNVILMGAASAVYPVSRCRKRELYIVQDISAKGTLRWQVRQWSFLVDFPSYSFTTAPIVPVFLLDVFMLEPMST
jgi:hypothetical protein